MIRLVKSGTYKLIETRSDTKILLIDGDAEFAWVTAKRIGEILVVSHKEHQTDAVLTVGRYNLFEVKNEPSLTDLTHLELEVGSDQWQGYMLPTGFPNDVKKRSRIVSTKQLITTNPDFEKQVQPRKLKEK